MTVLTYPLKSLLIAINFHQLQHTCHVQTSDCNRLQVTACPPLSTAWDCARRHDDDDNTLAPTRGRSNDYFSFAIWHIGVGTPCITWKHRFRLKIQQDFGVVGTQPPTALAVSGCTHTAQKPVVPPRLPLCLCREGRGKVISILWLGVPALSRSYLRFSYTWGTHGVLFALTFHLCAWSISLVSLVLKLQLFLGSQRFLARNHAVVMLRIIVFFTHACRTLVCAPFTDSETGLFSHQCAKYQMALGHKKMALGCKIIALG